jgi:hypothetical protein
MALPIGAQVLIQQPEKQHSVYFEFFRGDGYYYDVEDATVFYYVQDEDALDDLIACPNPKHGFTALSYQLKY